MGMYMHSQVFVSSGTQAANMEKLNRLRNQFIHFVPVRLSEHVGDRPSIVLDATAVVSFLSCESRNATWYPGNDLELQTRKHLGVLFEEATRLTQLYRQVQR